MQLVLKNNSHNFSFTLNTYLVLPEDPAFSTGESVDFLIQIIIRGKAVNFIRKRAHLRY